MNENQDGADVSNQQEEVVLETATEEVVDDVQDDDSQEDIKAKLEKAEELAENYKIRAEKAERLAKASRNPEHVEKVAKKNDLGTKDLYALMEAKVPQEDVDDVVEYAAFKGISIVEALKSSVVKTTLAEKAEQRQTAEAANVGSSKRGSGKIPEDVLLAKASKGELPESDADLQRLVTLRRGYKQ